MHSHCIRAIASVTAKYQKMVNFTHFNKKKHPHQCLQNCAYIQKCYSNHAYMHDYCSFAYQYFINFTFRSFFFSLFSICKINASSLPHHLLLPLIHTLPQTQNQKSTTDTTKSNTLTHRHTNRDKESGSALVADRCLWIGEFQPWWIGAWIGEWPWMERRVSNGEWRESLR